MKHLTRVGLAATAQPYELLEVETTSLAESVRWVEPAGTSPVALARLQTSWAWLRQRRGGVGEYVVLDDEAEAPVVVARIAGSVLHAQVFGDDLICITREGDGEAQVHRGPIAEGGGQLARSTPLVGLDYVNLTLAGGALWFVDGSTGDLVTAPV